MVFKASKNNSANLQALRVKRDELLAATDWAILPDSPLTAQDKNALLAYRQALRACTEAQPGMIAALPAIDVYDLPSKIVTSLQRLVLSWENK